MPQNDLLYIKKEIHHSIYSIKLSYFLFEEIKLDFSYMSNVIRCVVLFQKQVVLKVPYCRHFQVLVSK